MEKEIKNPVKVIRAYCLFCCNGQHSEVRDCDIERCPLHKWRFGVNPYLIKKPISEERKKELSNRLRTAKLNKK